MTKKAENSNTPLKPSLDIADVSGCAHQFEEDVFKLINTYCKAGLKKPDLVRKMKWITGSCERS